MKARKRFTDYRKQLFQSSFQYRGPHLSPQDVDKYYAHLDILAHLAEKLVHLDNKQLHHPIIRWLFPQLSKDSKRRLHRGLETGVKRDIGSIKGILGDTEEERFANAVMVLNIIRKDRKLLPWDSVEAYSEQERQDRESWREKLLQQLKPKESDDAAEQRRKARLANDINEMFPWDAPRPKSYLQIQRDLEKPVFDEKGKIIRQALVKKMKRQAFHQMQKRLLAPGPRPLYNENAVPPLPKEIPTEWLQAQGLLRKYSEILNEEATTDDRGG